MFVQSTVEAPCGYGERWPRMYPSVILCGNDTTLLMTRKLVLEQAGLSVRTLLGIDTLGEAAGVVLVLCFTLSEIERVAAVAVYRSHFPGAKILILGGDPRAFAGERYKTLPEYPGPRLFVQGVSQLVADSRLGVSLPV